ncbi:FAD-dependent oxidoreductase [bacterium]|nr:FAD-dependent oxidoreductase [bacterium]
MKIIIIGGVAAGAKAAAKSRRLQPEAQIDLYTDDTHISYSSCGLPYYIEGNFEDYEQLLVRSPEDFEKIGIKVHLRHKVTKILPNCKQILVEDLENNKAILDCYDRLIIATGARPYIPPIKNTDLKNIFTLRKIEDGINIKNKLLASKNAVIVGGGYIGLELLEAFVRQNVHVTLLEHGKHLMKKMDEDMSELIYNQLTEASNNRFEIHLSEEVVEFEGDENGVKFVITASGKRFDTDLVVIASGVRPNSEIAKDAGIELGAFGAIAVNDRMQTNIEDIYACGDCCEDHLIVSDTKIWMPLGSTANKEGRTASINACGGDDVFKGVLASAVTRCLKLTMSMTGLTVKEAENLGYKPVFATVTKNDKVGFMPDVNNITLKLVADKDTGLLLGCQAVGTGDADKRVNIVTSALLAKMTARDFYNNDITYAPPYSPTIDPLLNAAQILAGKIDEVKSEM